MKRRVKDVFANFIIRETRISGSRRIYAFVIVANYRARSQIKTSAGVALLFSVTSCLHDYTYVCVCVYVVYKTKKIIIKKNRKNAFDA